MLFKLLCLLCIYKASSLEKVTFDLDNAKNIFDEFIKKFGKHYVTEEEYDRRLEIFKNNLEDINNRNKNFTTEVYGITQFLDMTDEEFNRDHTDLKLNPNLKDLYEEPDDLEPMMGNYYDYYAVPDSWDWRDLGVVTPVKQQGSCGSCWAFSAVGCVESQYAIKHGTLYALSEQQLVDCFNKEGRCKTGSPPNEALTLKQALATIFKFNNEPYCMEATLRFQGYSGGISTPEGLGCGREQKLNHAVVLVGYGTTEYGVPYWIIKNSYGEEWGEEGFMRLIRGRNACSMLGYVVIAEVP